MYLKVVFFSSLMKIFSNLPFIKALLVHLKNSLRILSEKIMKCVENAEVFLSN